MCSYRLILRHCDLARLGWACGFFFAAGILSVRAQIPSGEPTLSAGGTPVSSGQPLRAANSCATSTCHGGVMDRGPAWNHSLSTFQAKDPHANAGKILRSDAPSASRRIVERLNPEAATDQKVYNQTLVQRCVGCHTSATHDDLAVMNQGFGSHSSKNSPLAESTFRHAIANGVQCDSCHGDSAGWLVPHTLKSFANAGAKRFAPPFSMRDTKSIQGRAQTCVRCHIGSRTSDGVVRDVNHDLIAAGHPALRFDLLIFTENLPKHWNDRGEVERRFQKSSRRVRKWGQNENLISAARLAAERARDSMAKEPKTPNDPSVPWPELADYDCFACHQSLAIDQYVVGLGGERLSSERISDGLPLWNAWHTLSFVDGKNRSSLKNGYRLNRENPEVMLRRAEALAEKLAERVSNETESSIPALETVRSQLALLKQTPPRDWHSAAAIYLELDAAVRDLLVPDEVSAAAKQDAKQALGEMETRLRFRENGQTIFQSDPMKFNQIILQRLSNLQ